jgi:hypothetical protein
MAWLTGLAAIMPLAAAAPAPAAPTEAETTQPFQPPAGPMLLTRTTRRTLHDGKPIMARRSYEVRFIREGEGYRIDGELVDVAVEVPPQLEAVAELERKRPDEGMFPLHLDASGKLVRSERPPQSEANKERIAAVAGMVDHLRLSEFDKGRAKAFVLGFQTRPGYSAWPEDLFHPAPGKRRETRTIPLVNGERGKIVVETTADTGPDGLLASLTRRVTSEIDDDWRAISEEWTLAPR